MLRLLSLASSALAISGSVLEALPGAGIEAVRRSVMDSGMECQDVGLGLVQRGAGRRAAFPGLPGFFWEVNDTVQAKKAVRETHDEAQVQRLMKQGKIKDGFADLLLSHIPKAGGDSMGYASAPIAPYGFSQRYNDQIGVLPRHRPPSDKIFTCPFEQLPPKYAADYFSNEAELRVIFDRTVFCSVREPYNRLLSGFKHVSGYIDVSCTAAGLNAWVSKEITALLGGDLFRLACFLTPQSNFLDGPYGCKRVLDFAHLDEEFSGLMEEFGYNLTLPVADTFHYHPNVVCNVSEADLTPSSYALINKAYARDFEEIGPKFGWSTRSA